MNTRTPPATGRGVAGFSLVETLVALLLLLVIMIGILPLFTTSMTATSSGKELSEVTNHARSRIEEFKQLPFNAPPLTLTGGTSLVFEEHFSYLDNVWRAGLVPGNADDTARYTRVTTVRQFNIDTLLKSGGPTDADALPAGADPGSVHLKEIVVEVESNLEPGSPLGNPKTILLRTLKSQ